MILDKQNLWSDAQSIAAAAGTVVSTNAIDLGAAQTDTLGNTLPRDPGRGGQVEMIATLTETVTSGGAATVQAQLVSSANADLSSPTVLQSTAALALATLKAGYQFRLALPAGINQRYIGMQYVIGTATTTAGKVTAGIVAAKQTTPGVDG